jgi:hypothetical protein
MARTVLTPTEFVKETPKLITSTATTVDSTLVTAGVVLTTPLDGRYLIVVKQTDSAAKELYIKSAPEYGDGTFFTITQDMAQNAIYGTVLENAKHTRGFGDASDDTDKGKIYIDFETGFTGTIECYFLSDK